MKFRDYFYKFVNMEVTSHHGDCLARDKKAIRVVVKHPLFIRHSILFELPNSMTTRERWKRINKRAVRLALFCYENNILGLNKIDNALHSTYSRAMLKNWPKYKHEQKTYFVTGTDHGSHIVAFSEGEARRIFHKHYKGESITHIHVDLTEDLPF